MYNCIYNYRIYNSLHFFLIILRKITTASHQGSDDGIDYETIYHDFIEGNSYN